MRIVIGLIMALSAGAASAQAARLPPPITQASNGSLQCYSPNAQAKTCRALAGYFRRADGTIANFPTNPATYSPNWSFQWGIAATPNTTVNGIGTSLPLPSALGSQGLPQQPNLDSYVDLFETIANGGDPRSLHPFAPPPNDQFWLYNNGQGRVTYIVPG